MKNRRFELGRPVKMPKKLKHAPPEFVDWLCVAAKEGDEFAPQYLELSPHDVYRAYQSKLKAFKAMSRRNPAVVNALIAMFNYTLSRTILDNPDEERWLIREALHCSVEAQNRITMAMLWLPPGDRATLLTIWDKANLDNGEWQIYFRGSMAVARFVYSAAKFGVTTRLAQADHDVQRKIDLFCEPPIHGNPTLCVQIKSHAHATGASIVLLPTRPNPEGISPEEYRIRLRVWRGVQDFNGRYNRRWLPVLVRVGMRGALSDRLYDQELDCDLGRFFSELSQRSSELTSRPFEPFSNKIYACA